MLSTWKADRRSLQCMCCHDNGELLLTAGSSIKLWNLKDHTQIKVRGDVIFNFEFGFESFYILPNRSSQVMLHTSDCCSLLKTLTSCLVQKMTELSTFGKHLLFV